MTRVNHDIIELGFEALPLAEALAEAQAAIVDTDDDSAESLASPTTEDTNQP